MNFLLALLLTQAPAQLVNPPTVADVGGVATSRSVGTGTATSTGLSGGGDLSADRSLSCASASASSVGCVTTGTQTLAGAKTVSSTLASSVASGSDGFSLLQGARLKLNSGTDTSYIYADTSQYVHIVSKSKDFTFDEFGVLTGANYIIPSSGAQLELRPQTANTTNGIGVLINTGVTFSALNTLPLVIKNNTVQKFAVDKDGAAQFTGIANASLPTCNAGMKGALQYDTTNNKLVLCNGSAWQTITSS